MTRRKPPTVHRKGSAGSAASRCVSSSSISASVSAVSPPHSLLSTSSTACPTFVHFRLAASSPHAASKSSTNRSCWVHSLWPASPRYCAPFKVWHTNRPRTRVVVCELVALLVKVVLGDDVKEVVWVLVVVGLEVIVEVIDEVSVVVSVVSLQEVSNSLVIVAAMARLSKPTKALHSPLFTNTKKPPTLHRGAREFVVSSGEAPSTILASPSAELF